MKRSAFLKPIKGGTVTIQATDGRALISDQKELFDYYICSDFKNWGLNKIGEATPETVIQVFELIKDATLSQIFNSMPDELDNLCLAQSQVIDIAKNHRRLLKLEDYANLFLTKENNEYFVIRIHLFSLLGGGLSAGINRFDDTRVWDGSSGFRVVSRKLQKP